MSGVAGRTTVDKRPRVLCVDDEPAVLDSPRRQLYTEFAVVGGESGPEALALLQKDASFAVLVTDMRLRRFPFPGQALSSTGPGRRVGGRRRAAPDDEGGTRAR
jgi:CheY-like chemotaxis protein